MPACPWERQSRSQRGTALIEFALILPILLVLTLAAVDLGRAFFTKNILHQAAREGVRMMVVMASPISEADKGLVRARAAEVASAAGLTLTPDPVVEGPDPTTKMDFVSVTANFTWTFPLLFKVVGLDVTNPMPLTADCYMRQE